MVSRLWITSTAIDAHLIRRSPIAIAVTNSRPLGDLNSSSERILGFENVQNTGSLLSAQETLSWLSLKLKLCFYIVGLEDEHIPNKPKGAQTLHREIVKKHTILHSIIYFSTLSSTKEKAAETQ
ncbi:hypothetical protein EK904_001608 [Melospiza melodia maxima]|nr:hypothetical protein EK904_001608 [Melospiza melodia maxima]